MSIELAHPDQLSDAWSSPESIAVGHDPRHLALTAASDGKLHLVWENGRAVLHTFRSDEIWRGPTRVSGGSQPSAASGPNGAVHVSFVNDFSGRPEIYHTAWNQLYWTLPLNISMTPKESANPVILLDDKGARHAVWEDYAPNRAHIYHGRHRTGWRWDNYPVPSASGRLPAAAFDAEGRLHLAYQTGADGEAESDILYAALEHGQWTPPQLISTGEHPATAPALAVDEHNQVHVVWREHESGQDIVRYAKGRPHEWLHPQAISPALQMQTAPTLALAKDAYMHSAWDFGQKVEQGQRSAQKTEWEPLELAAVEAQTIRALALTADADGRVHAVWACDSTNGRCELRHCIRKPAMSHKVFLPFV